MYNKVSIGTVLCEYQISSHFFILWIYDRSNSIIICAGSSLSQDGIIAIASSIFVFTVSSISFTLFGYLCRRKQEQKSSSSANKPHPIYESVQIMNNTKNLMVDVETNVAYLTVQH